MASLGFSSINGDDNVVRMRVICQTLRKSWPLKIKSDTPLFLSLAERSNTIEASGVRRYMAQTEPWCQSLHMTELCGTSGAVSSLCCECNASEIQGRKGTHGGCLNNSASINYSGISCGWTKIDSLGPLFLSCLHSAFFFFWWPSKHDSIYPQGCYIFITDFQEWHY